MPNLGSRHNVSFVSGCLSLVCLWGLANVAMASSPELKSILPRGGQRGLEVEVTFNGERLADAEQILIYEPGIEVVSHEIVNDKQIKAKLKVATDCSLGTKHFRVRTKSGLTDMRTFRVGALPAVAEVEPNSEFVKPQVVPLNCTVEGAIGNEDVDYFVVDAKKGDRISAEVEAIRLGDSFFDVYVAIMNEARFELATSDDAALVYQDGVVSLIAPEDGKYIIQVRESAYGGGSQYRCHIGTFPRPRAIVPSGGKLGSTVAVKFLGDVAGELSREITIPAEVGPDFAVFAEDERGISPSGMAFRVSPLDNIIEQEPNNAVAEGTPASSPAAFNGVIGSPGDVDFYKFAAKKGQQIDVRVHARRLRSELDSLITLHNAQGGNIAANDDTGGPDSYLRFNPPADGDYFLSIKDHLGRGGDAFHYRVELEPVTPKLELSVNEFVQYREARLVVPQGNRLPLLINATRRDFGGPIDFLGEGLPAGVTVDFVQLAPDQQTAQVMLVAAADAPVGASFGRLTGKLSDPNQPLALVSGDTKQECVMVRGQNQRPFFLEELPALALVVSEAAPFSLEVVEPKVPLVQNGQMQLKVVAKRAEGFTAPIKVDLLLNPPGVNSSREISIAEGQTEALININAAGNAQVKEHKVAVRGEATVKDGPVMVATPFVTLRIAEPYLKFEFKQAAIELGQESALVVKAEALKPFEGDAQVTLMGLPNKVTTEPVALNKDLKEFEFKIKADAEAAPGINKNLFCQVVITESGEPITHTIGSATLRVDKPLPPKVAPPANPMPNAKPAEAKPAEAPAKRLSRLEQLRLEQKQKLESQNGAAPK